MQGLIQHVACHTSAQQFTEHESENTVLQQRTEQLVGETLG